MDDIAIIPVYRVLNALRDEIGEHLTKALQAMSDNNFDHTEQLLTEARRMVLVLQTLTEEQA